jgi:putative SOS response-associated peptidase YedK
MCGRASCTFLVYNTSNSSNTSSNTSTASPNNNNNNDNKKKSIQSIADIQFISNLDLLKSFKPSKNLSPNNLFPIIYNNKNKNQDITIMNWGIKYQNINNMIINSRIETIEETIFKSLLKNNRCVAVIDGFYEFKKVMKDDRVY